MPDSAVILNASSFLTIECGPHATVNIYFASLSHLFGLNTLQFLVKMFVVRECGKKALLWYRMPFRLGVRI